MWQGGNDLIAQISGDLTPELAYLGLDRADSLILASDTSAYLSVAMKADTGDARPCHRAR